MIRPLLHAVCMAVLAGTAYAAPGDPLTPPMVVSTTADQRLFNPRVDRAPAGAFVVSWSHFDGGLGTRDGIRARAFDGAGNPTSGQVEVVDVPGRQARHDVAVTDDGSFVVVWLDEAVPEHAVRLRRYAANGNALGEALTVSTPATDGVNTVPRVSMDGAGVATVAWHYERVANAPRVCRFPRLACTGGDVVDAEIRARRVLADDRLGGQQTLVALRRLEGVLTIASVDAFRPAPLLPRGQFAVLALDDIAVAPTGAAAYLWHVRTDLYAIGGTPRPLVLGRLDAAGNASESRIVDLTRGHDTFCGSESLDIAADGAVVVGYTDGCAVAARRMLAGTRAGPELDVDAVTGPLPPLSGGVAVAAAPGGAFAAVYDETLVPFAAGVQTPGQPAALPGLDSPISVASDAAGELVVASEDDDVVYVQRFAGP